MYMFCIGRKQLSQFLPEYYEDNHQYYLTECQELGRVSPCLITATITIQVFMSKPMKISTKCKINGKYLLYRTLLKYLL